MMHASIAGERWWLWSPVMMVMARIDTSMEGMLHWS